MEKHSLKHTGTLCFFLHRCMKRRLTQRQLKYLTFPTCYFITCKLVLQWQPNFGKKFRLGGLKGKYTYGKQVHLSMQIQPLAFVFTEMEKINLKRIPVLKVNFALCLHKSWEDAVTASEYCMNVCTNKIPLKRYQIFQKYKYLINFDLRRQSAYSSDTSACLLDGEVQTQENFPGKFSGNYLYKFSMFSRKEKLLFAIISDCLPF